MDNRLDYYLSKIEKQLDFHKGLHLFEMETNPNFTNKVVFLKENQEEYITNLFGDNKNIRESYNREFKNNIIVESTFNPKDEVEKFFSFIKENYIKEIEKSNLINEETSINEQWERGKDTIGYWKVLFDKLKAAGLGPKYGANGKPVTDPKLSTFIYAGPWVISKDKTNSYPIYTKRKGVAYSAKITSNGGKYIGEDLLKTMLGVYDAKSKTLVKMSLNGFLKGTDEAFVAQMAKGGGEQKIKQETETAAKNVVAKLKAAFDRDKDNVYDDYDGTDEKGALAAINLISSKNVLDRVNQLIASSARPYGSLKDWVNDEMSDIDRDQYKAIWDRLGKLGYKGYVQNDFLAATGKGDVVGMAKAGFTWLKDKGLPWFMEKLRDALGSTAGAILQQLLNYTGVGAIGVTVLWAVLTLFDVSQIASGLGSWAKLIFSVFGLLTAGVLAKAIGGFLKPLFKATGGGISTFFANIAKKPWFITYVKPAVGKIGQAIGWASGLLKQAGDWVVKKLGATAIGGMVGKAVKWLESISEMVVKYAGFESKQTTTYLAKKDLQNQGKKVVSKLVTDPLKDKTKSYTKEKVAQVAGYVGGEKAKTAVELGYNVSDLTKKPKDIIKTFDKGVDVKSLTKAGEKVVKTVDKVGTVIDQGKQIASTEPVGGVKKAV